MRGFFMPAPFIFRKWALCPFYFLRIGYLVVVAKTVGWDEAEEKIRTCVEGLGFEFVGAQRVGSGVYTVLRVLADSPAGITINQITQITHQLMGVIEVEMPDYRDYTIEVSSPGLDRPLFKLADYQRFTGRKVRVSLSEPLEGQRHFIGVLVKADAEQITLELEENRQQITLPFSAIAKAKLIPVISFKN